MGMLAADRQAAIDAGAAAVLAYHARTRSIDGTPIELGDLLLDVRHFADAKGLNWQDAVDYMERHYRVES
jgi:hypothetical protein